MGGTVIDWSSAARQAARAHELLGSNQADLDSLPLRTVVRESWKRSLSSRVRSGEPPVLSEEHLRLAREHSELQRIWPVFEKLLVPAATDANLLVALADAQGTLLWVAGSNGSLNGAERVGFAAGANWGESAVGTSAPGLALATGNGVQVTGAEHLYQDVHHLNCSAVPIRNPATGRVIGAVDLTGGADAIAVHSLPLLQAAVAAAESQLLLPGIPAPQPGADFLDLCGADGPELSGTSISLRHAEILTLLAAHPRGLSNAELVEELFEHPDTAAVGTVRSEIVRLRKVLSAKPGRTLAARPYRLEWALETTVCRLWQALEAGDLEQALQLCPTELLARSQAPGIIAMRHRAQAAIREVALDRGTAQQLLRLGRQSGDAQFLMAALRELPPDSPARSLVVAEVEQLQD
ncbi:transcriptional regulator [Glutamicibacter sp. MNS18]|uniref:helix-turn-helix domain-containing protein n=1 Tax=Glutamicibacter sp. MNS18 TaxID=2989817 RepID=UPI00223634CD|nr:GAF domain-containing protein [Glutamicibacter sp. MNS18]MCW4466086.1 transcriptional regulator [Glutamicibacter sp. MNS18]